MWKIKEFIDSYDMPVDKQVNKFVQENNITQNYSVVGYQRIQIIEDDISQSKREESSIIIKYWDNN